MDGSRSSTRDIMTWGTMLEQEPNDVSRRARQLFQKAKKALSPGSGQSITGLCGNDKALACICLCSAKIQMLKCDRKAVETSLQRTSGVAPRVFLNALKQLPIILQKTDLLNASLIPKSPTKKKSPEKRPIEKDFSEGMMSKGKGVARVLKDSRDSLMKSSPLKRRAATESGSEDELMLSPTTKKRLRISENLPSSPSKPAPSGSNSQTPRPTKVFEPPTTRTILKTPLNLPIKKPLKPMCIFQSQPVFNPKRHEKPQVNFSDWNWKSSLFQTHWSLDDIQEWQDWNAKSIESSLS